MYTKKEPNKRKIILPNMVIWQALFFNRRQSYSLYLLVSGADFLDFLKVLDQIHHIVHSRSFLSLLVRLMHLDLEAEALFLHELIPNRHCPTFPFVGVRENNPTLSRFPSQ